jgi:hypothetical protein
MPRKARIDAAGALDHIIVRGIERRKFFCDHLARGYDFNWLVDQVANRLSFEQEIVTCRRYPDTIEARNVLCYWATRELGIGTIEPSKRLGISQSTAANL